MNRLQSELDRLYLLPASPEGDGLVGAEGRVRALVLEVARPARWDDLAPAWRGVQDELELPAPAIAVSGREGLQLWLSLAEPVSAARAHAFLERLQARFLPEVAAPRVRLWPQEPARASGAPQHAPPVPAQQGDADHWSAFVAPGLAPVFADTPWLDIEPGIDGQADLLARQQSIARPAFEAAEARLARAATEPAPPPAAAAGTAADAGLEPKQFLLQVMRDERVALALRIEAAKALLPFTGEARRS